MKRRDPYDPLRHLARWPLLASFAAIFPAAVRLIPRIVYSLRDPRGAFARLLGGALAPHDFLFLDLAHDEHARALAGARRGGVVWGPRSHDERDRALAGAEWAVVLTAPPHSVGARRLTLVV